MCHIKANLFFERYLCIGDTKRPTTKAKKSTQTIIQSIEPPRKDAHRGKDYNHSSFCDLIITGLAGIRVNSENSLVVHPLFTADQLDYFCADGIPYHGHSITVFWDKTGDRYKKGVGLQVLCDGNIIAKRSELSEVKIDL